MARRRWFRRKWRGYVTAGMLRPSNETLQVWALEHDDPDVAFDAAVQLAHRDRMSTNLREFLVRWVPKRRMSPVLFDRFCGAWEKCVRERMVQHLGTEVKLPEDLRVSPSGE